jgi:hypothetical protein
VEEAGAAQVAGDLHKAQRLGIKMLLPSQTMASENETSLQRRKTRRIPPKHKRWFGSLAKIFFFFFFLPRTNSGGGSWTWRLDLLELERTERPS